MVFWKRLGVIFLVSLCCIGCDRASKRMASKHLAGHSVSSHFNDMVRLGYTENRGAFLGLGKDLSEKTRFLIFTVVVGVFLAGLLAYLVFSIPQNSYTLIALSCIFSGGVSNFLDRAMNSGAVIDFLNVGVGPLRTGVFNIADMAIIFGAVLFFLASGDDETETSSGLSD